MSEQDGASPPPPPRLIETTAEQVATAPDGLTTVPINVVSVAIDVEFTEPELVDVADCTLWSMEKVSALVAVQLSVVWPPELTLVGDAESVQVGAAGVGVGIGVGVGVGVGGGGGVTEIPVLQVVCPPGPETVIV